MAIWFTADTHCGQGGIIRMCERPFHDVIEIDVALIGAWNAKVRPGDHVWHLGDFALGHDADTLREIFDGLHGTEFLVKGNHDTDEVLALPWARPPEKPVEIAADAVRIVACHDPVRAWGALGRTLHLHGHTHRPVPDPKGSCDVGVDSWGYAPSRIADVRTRLVGVTLDAEERREIRRRD
ncbi:metallophosphoesterase family protein [Methylobacterium aerolatum]|uniref:Calcineurin-like phosphoesterase family protein n=1 Tax=Methylobacterium aerolatum TaxID=418708 RepID=A0ABU0HWX7_9HYPH|nr:metallophosphoesterase family protein [Methylobacterium aerolatum]MDQ0446839.1 calcineurin-like phosphoesterase family protein [Methylobacterium aerolatum]GJD33804.1 hypothetical protein FMGBMHLM_0697 [Methylobacterium aerolatum]